MALLTPFLLILFLSTAEVGNALNAYMSVINATREGARLASRGNIFQPDQVLLVVKDQCNSLKLDSSGSVLLTTVHSDTNTFTASVQTLLGSHASKFTTAALQDLERQATTSDPAYLRKEDFVVLEIFYDHPTLTGLLVSTIPIYAHTVMPISAPS
jgi:Flp pilus assembly protein TadG